MAPQRDISARGQEDLLGLLTARAPIRFRKGAIIYSELKQPGYLYLVLRGRVAVNRGADDHPVVIEVYGPEEFFGECALLNMERLPEQAVALERTEIMRWTRNEIENLVLQRPQLGLALMQMLARRSIEFGARLQDCLGGKTARRVLRSLVR